MHFARKVLNAPKTLLRTCAFFDFRRGSKKRIHLQLLPMFCECLSFFEKPFVYNHCHCDSFVSLKLIFCHGGGQQHTVSVDQKQDNVAAYRKTMLMQKKKTQLLCNRNAISAPRIISTKNINDDHVDKAEVYKKNRSSKWAAAKPIVYLQAQQQPVER